MSPGELVAADLEYKLQTAARMTRDDIDCARYLIENRGRLFPEMVKASERTGEDVCAVIARFSDGVHQRHLAGLPLARVGPGEQPKEDKE